MNEISDSIAGEIKSKSIFFFDLDGVLRVGKDETKLLGGRKIISKLSATGRDYRILSNTTTATAEDLSKTLKPIGLEIPKEKILTASHLTARYLKEKFGPSRCFLLGEEKFGDELLSFGHEVIDLDSNYEENVGKDSSNSFVVVGLDRNLNFRKLNHAMVQIRDHGARIVACHVARAYYDSGGPTISVGPLVAALEYAAKTKLFASIGKPSPTMFEIALSECGKESEDALMAGDQLEVDIAGANSVGIFSVLVLTGLDNRVSADLATSKPNCILNNVDDLTRFI